jgi:hypothetical protein
VNQRPDDGRVAIFAVPSTRPRGGANFPSCAFHRGDNPAGAEGIYEMRQVGSLLRSAPSRIRRRLALIVAIAAASLPAAGA